MTVSEPIHHVERAVSDPPIPALARRRQRRDPRIDDGLMGMALLLGPANVIMQLARPG
ncbi:MAG: oxygenase MpaB family protein, partial [Mycobacterium sp.]